MSNEFTAKVRAYFAQYKTTVTLVDKLIQSKSHPQEILILICSRLDALANSIGSDNEGQQKKFVSFITNYGRSSNLFRRVSIGDLYYEIGYHRWILSGLIPQPGRFHIFSDVNREVAILLDESGVDLTQQAADRFLHKIQDCITANFRARWRQSQKKPVSASADEITSALVKGIHGLPNTALANLPKAIAPLLNIKTGGAILYQRFRSQVIHGGKVRLDEKKFFVEKRPYWKPLFSEYYGSFLFLEFPALFLSQLLVDSIRTYEHHLTAKGKVPPDIHFDMFPDDTDVHLDWLDEKGLPRGQDIRLSIPRR